MKFEVYQSEKSKEYYFRLKAGNGQIILGSEGYTTKKSCLNGVESVRKNSQEDARFERKTAKNGKPFFNLKAANGQAIGKSQIYASAAGMEKGIDSVKRVAPEASLTDLTE